MFQTDLIFKSNLNREDDALFSGFWETCPRDCDAQILESTHYLLHGAGLVVENLRYMPLEHVLRGDHRHLGRTVFERIFDHLELVHQCVTVRFKADLRSIQR